MGWLGLKDRLALDRLAEDAALLCVNFPLTKGKELVLGIWIDHFR